MTRIKSETVDKTCITVFRNTETYTTFTDCYIIIQQEKDTVKLGQRELEVLEKVIGAKFKI